MEFSFSPFLKQATAHFDQKSLLKIFEKHGIAQENFTTVISPQDTLNQIKDLYQRFSHKKQFIHIGMGGSSLGPEMLIRALENHSPLQFHFLNNPDPESVIPVIEQCDLSESLFYIVSKSGTTAETMAMLALVTTKLKTHGIAPSHWKEYLVFCTGHEGGDLRAMAQDLDIPTLPIPRGVGGRFSVLTPVGLFPAHFAQIPLQELLQGAHDSLEQIDRGSIAQLVDSIDQYYDIQGVSQTVLMSYCDRLKGLNSWFIQLWAESLGKEGIGLTPLQAIGTSDQHSQMQLFMDGPCDKFFIFIQVKKFAKTGKIESNLSYPSIRKLQGVHLSHLIQCHLKGTLMAMDHKKIPYALITLEQLEARELGQLIMFFEILTTLVGDRLQINPFNQPGVELGKRYAFQILGQ